MLVRSPRKFATFALVACTFIIIVLQQSPWTTSIMYERITLFRSPENISPTASTQGTTQGPLNVDLSETLETLTTQKLPWQTGKGKSLVDGEEDRNRTRITDWKAYMKAMLKWPRPNWEGHWPPFAEYADKEYDPNRWEEFEMDDRVYRAGLDKLDFDVASSPRVYKPLPEYNTEAWRKRWAGEYVACVGPRGVPLNGSADDEVLVYGGIPKGFPKVFSGGYDVVGLDSDVCFDRYSRYGAYGFGDDASPDEVRYWKAPKSMPRWSEVRWGGLQDQCLERNKNRYHPGARSPTVMKPTIELPSSADDPSASPAPTSSSIADIEGRATGEKRYHHRTAVLIRAWTGYKYEENDIISIRAMISELSLQSGGEYTVYLLIHVKDTTLKIFEDSALYDKVLKENVPKELRDIAILWSEAIFPSWYPLVQDWQVYWQQFMCLQWFSITHPEFEFVWNWETDARYTGHHYHLLEKLGGFADRQPRKLVWERNKRFYIPSIHGSYESFVEKTHADVLNASYHNLIPAPVWGPRPWTRAIPPQQPLGPNPPTSFEKDAFEWGVNEPADLITLLPIWDPRNTSWSYKDKIWNYIPGTRPVFTPQDGAADWFTHPDFASIDRRVFINTVVRFSKKLLYAMHGENAVGRSMQAEMWPASVALQYGYKAVYAPHPGFVDRVWPAAYAEAVFDTASTVDPVSGAAMESVQGAWTEQQDSPYNHDREYNFQGWSWYFASRFPRRLYRRWLGWAIDKQDWGEEERIEGGLGSDGLLEEKRMCLPGMLLHPVKGMREGDVKV